MTLEKKPKIIEVNADNVSEIGFFCYMSKRKTEGFQRKLRWLKERFAEGMKIKMLQLPDRGFIEYVPGEYAWRAVKAKGFMFIHCLWIVGKSRGKEYATLLLNECIKDAKKAGMRGVAMVTSEGNWLVSKKFLLKQRFKSVAQAPPSFELMVKKFASVPSPSFANDWEKKAKRYGKGLTIVRTDQCPYLENATKNLLESARELGIKSRVVELHNCQEVQSQSPSAYGVFSVIHDGNLLSYHWLLKEEFLNRLEELNP